MSVDRLKSFFSKTVQDSKHHDTVSDSGFSSQATVSMLPSQLASRSAGAASVSAETDLPMLPGSPAAQNSQFLKAFLVAGLVLVAGAALYVFTLQHPNAPQVGLAALLIGSGAIAWQARAARIERDIARAESERSEAINQAMMLMFREASDRGRADSITARELIDSTAKRLVGSLDLFEWFKRVREGVFEFISVDDFDTDEMRAAVTRADRHALSVTDHPTAAALAES